MMGLLARPSAATWAHVRGSLVLFLGPTVMARCPGARRGVDLAWEAL
jgi:hypothetical protein